MNTYEQKYIIKIYYIDIDTNFADKFSVILNMEQQRCVTII